MVTVGFVLGHLAHKGSHTDPVTEPGMRREMGKR